MTILKNSQDPRRISSWRKIGVLCKVIYIWSKYNLDCSNQIDILKILFLNSLCLKLRECVLLKKINIYFYITFCLKSLPHPCHIHMPTRHNPMPQYSCLGQNIQMGNDGKRQLFKKVKKNRCQAEQSTVSLEQPTIGLTVDCWSTTADCWKQSNTSCLKFCV